MEPIDQPFRPKLDFYIVWAFLAVAVFCLTYSMEKDEGWYAYAAILILLSLFATIILYGPVLLTRQIIRSGSRGWFVARVMVSILLGVIVFCGLLYLTGKANNNSAMWSGIIAATATTYLHWRLGNKPRS